MANITKYKQSLFDPTSADCHKDIKNIFQFMCEKFAVPTQYNLLSSKNPNLVYKTRGKCQTQIIYDIIIEENKPREHHNVQVQQRNLLE